MLEIISILLNLVLGSSLVLFYSANRRKQAAEATGAEFDINRRQIEFLSHQLNEAYNEIDKMQDIINEKRNQIIDLIRQTKQLEMSVINSRSLLCGRAECAHREEVSNE